MIQVWSGAGQPWDNHDHLEAEHKKLSDAWDRPIAAFLTDLKQRGLLESTLVLWGGEFGRTPVAELPALSGRDHNHYGFSVWMAGGGVRGGYAHGATDDFGFAAVDKPVHVHDLHATILHLLGFDHEKLTYRYAGRDFRLTDVHGQVVQELLA
jgi:arylsulfatase A-like enzyme